jgi:hypothetical protein
MATKKATALVTVPAAQLVVVTEAQKKAQAFLRELEEWMELPFASPRFLAQSAAVFTLLKHGETTFTDEETGEARPTHLWLAQAQGVIEYENNAGEIVNLQDGEKFIISQSKNAMRDRIAVTLTQIQDECNGAPIPNVGMRTARVGKKAKAKGWSPPVTFYFPEAAD